MVGMRVRRVLGCYMLGRVWYNGPETKIQVQHFPM